MTSDRAAALERLLTEPSAAHGVYEKTELNGVYDEEWSRWYAGYAVDHGIGELLGRQGVTADELARFLEQSWDEQQRAEPKATESWAAYTARRMSKELAS